MHRRGDATLAVLTLWASLAASDAARASIVVSFTGQLTNVSASGSVDAITPYLAAGDTFSGYFVYNELASGASQATINNIGSWKVYTGTVTNFSLTFLTGNSAGYSIDGVNAGISNLSVANNILFSSSGPVMDHVSGLIWQPSNVEFRPGLRERHVTFHFQDMHEANLTSSAALADLDFNQVAANADQPLFGLTLSFNATATNFAQTANFVFTSFSAPTSAPAQQSVAAGDPSPFTLLPPGEGTLHVDLPAGTTDGVFEATYQKKPLSEVLASGIASAGPVDFAIPGDVFQYWMLDFSGTLPQAGTTVTFTYDERALAPGTDESRLAIYHYTNGAWVLTPGTVDPVNNTIMVTGIDHFSPWGLGQTPAMSVPEPSSAWVWLVMLAGGPLVRSWRRRS